MPLYEYECRSCRHRFEALVRDASTPACPSCQGQDVERLLSLFAVSSEGTRKSALAAGKKHNRIAQRDRIIAQHEAEKHHDH